MFSQKILALQKQCLAEIQPQLASVDEKAAYNTAKVLAAFRKHQISDYHFQTTTGYAYGDVGREKLDDVWAELCDTEAALVRTNFVSGTHALATVLFGILRPNDRLLSLTGAPYDTMQTVIGYHHPAAGSLKEFGVAYDEMPMIETGVDIDNIKNHMTKNTKMVLIQRSRGYSLRNPLSIKDIEIICKKVKELNAHCICFVDNCYGEFVDTKEPTSVGADIMAGSLIKNGGGGLAPSGGYIVGKKDLVELAGYRLTAPGIGSELGASLAGNRLLYQGLFLAPHVVAQAIKGAIFAAKLFSILGYKTFPNAEEERHDIIQAIELGSPQKMIDFCRGLQKYSPVDAHVRPEPAPMPGYEDEIIMAAGTFVQGASIELSADGPIRSPYAVYLQGGLTFEHAMLGIMGAANEIEINR